MTRDTSRGRAPRSPDETDSVASFQLPVSNLRPTNLDRQANASKHKAMSYEYMGTNWRPRSRACCPRLKLPMRRKTFAMARVIGISILCWRMYVDY